MILGVGLDLCDVARIERALNNPRFLQRIYTERERSEIARRGAQTAAGLFAAKEALAKALGTGFSGFMPWDVEIASDGKGRPCATLLRGARDRMEALGGKSVLVSITHSGGFAAAVAILTDDAPTSGPREGVG